MFRRILVALDASPHSREALEAAVELAVRDRAELLGLFVEDANLLRLAELPFTREVGLSSGMPRRLDALQLEQSLRAQVRLIERLLRQNLRRGRIAGSLRVVRGQIVAELLLAARDADLVVVGRGGNPHRRIIGSNLRRILESAPETPLLVGRKAPPGRPVLVLFDGGEPSFRALAAALQLARRERDGLVVLIPQPGGAEAESLRDLAGQWLERQGAQARFLFIQGTSPGMLQRAVEAEQGRILVTHAPARGMSTALEITERLLGGLSCSLLLIR
ncbi:MAG: universal stress protein [Gammaproteobacteria bacterium]|nr:universal stress protein [Gammaproteobacteria bacterium]